MTCKKCGAPVFYVVPLQNRLLIDLDGFVHYDARDKVSSYFVVCCSEVSCGWMKKGTIDEELKERIEAETGLKKPIRKINPALLCALDGLDEN